jgi:hypothetical protein
MTAKALLPKAKRRTNEAKGKTDKYEIVCKTLLWGRNKVLEIEQEYK